jgi:C-terminal processing protease CtpA/Prc
MHVITATFLDGSMGLTITKEVNGSAVVTNIIPNGQADLANIKVSDIIVGVGSNTSTEYDEIMKFR